MIGSWRKECSNAPHFASGSFFSDKSSCFFPLGSCPPGLVHSWEIQDKLSSRQLHVCFCCNHGSVVLISILFRYDRNRSICDRSWADVVRVCNELKGRSAAIVLVLLLEPMELASTALWMLGYDYLKNTSNESLRPKFLKQLLPLV